MFYSTNVLQKKGPLGTIWIAAHHDVAKKLTKLQILNTNICETAEQIENPEQEMALRLSSHLLVGLSKIYTRKVQFLFTDCNEALSKITLAFRPSNVDLAPVSSKAQIKAITLEDPGISGIDLDLELNLTDADWLGSEVNLSQMSSADITLPDVMIEHKDDAGRMEEEDPLFFGGAIQGEDNPLDINYDAASPELPRDDDEPEMRRDSDGPGHLDDLLNVNMEEAAFKDDLPEFNPELAPARESELHPPSLGSVPPTPIRMSQASVGLELETPVLDAKRQRLASKRRKKDIQMDKKTELEKEVRVKWLESTSDLVRDPCKYPRKTYENAKLLNSDASGRSKLVSMLAQEPLSGYLGSRLSKFMIEQPSRREEVSQSSSKKRKVRAREAEEEVVDQSQLPTEPEELPGAMDEMAEVPEAPMDDSIAEPVLSQPDLSQDREALLASSSIFDEYEPDVEVEEGEGGQEKVQEHQERTKKVILMLQKNFKRRVSAQPLHFTQMIRTPEAAAPSKHTAAVAFFELLNLHAKGFVSLDQKNAFGDISIQAEDKLMKYRVRL